VGKQAPLFLLSPELCRAWQLFLQYREFFQESVNKKRERASIYMKERKFAGS
jgi:hypothetical protein